jgi:hypothetical protein
MCLADDWHTHADKRVKQHTMNQIIEQLKKFYDVTVSEANPELKALDSIIRTLAAKFNGMDPEEEEDEEDVAIRHKIEAQLWLKINRHQLATFRDYDINVRKPRLQKEVAKSGGVLDVSLPLHEELQSMDVGEEEELDSEERSEEESEYDLEYDEIEEEEEGDEDSEEDEEPAQSGVPTSTSGPA